jgi:signal transduction histidine kinase
MSLSQKVFDWTYFGTAYATHETEKRHIIFSNIVFLTLPIVYLVFILIDIKSFFDTTSILKFDRLVVPIIITLCIFFLFLNKWGLTTLSRVLFLISWILMLHILPIIIHQSPSDYYLAFPLGIIFHSILIHVSFSAKRDPWKFWLFLAGNFALLLMCKQLLVANDVTPESQNILRTDPYYTLDYILYWLLFNLLMSYLLYIFETYVSGLSKANTLIENQRKELTVRNGELRLAIKSLEEVNKRAEDLNKNLEVKVWERTKELEIKNEQLVQYAYMNAHKLRGPFCRVKGLVMLKDLVSKSTSEEEQRINSLLLESLEELDNVTSKIQRAVGPEGSVIKEK